MKLYICDNNNCRRLMSTTPTKIHCASGEEYHLCAVCADKIVRGSEKLQVSEDYQKKFIEKLTEHIEEIKTNKTEKADVIEGVEAGTRNNVEGSTVADKKGTESGADTEEATPVKRGRKKSTSAEAKQTGTKIKEEKKPVKSIFDRSADTDENGTEQSHKTETVTSTSGNRYEKIDAYGLDNIKHDYIEMDMGMTELSEKIGVDKSILYGYLKRHKIRKLPGTVKKTQDKKEIDLDRLRLDRDAVNKLKGLEESVNGHHCSECVYRNKELGSCWYTMVTDKSINANEDESKCTHFVDKEKVNI